MKELLPLVIDAVGEIPLKMGDVLNIILHGGPSLCDLFDFYGNLCCRVDYIEGRFSLFLSRFQWVIQIFVNILSAKFELRESDTKTDCPCIAFSDQMVYPILKGCNRLMPEQGRHK
jgi:hypothetical protein